MAILTILKANIRHRKGAFTSIALLMCIIALTITSTFSLNDNVKSNLIKSIENVDTGDFVALIRDDRLTDTLREGIAGNVQTERVRDVQAVAAGDYTVNGDTNGNEMNLEKWQGEYSVYNETATGLLEKPPELQAGEMYVPICYQMTYDCKTGSEVIIQTNTGSQTFTVKGFIKEPFVGPYVIGLKQIFVSETDFDRFWNDANKEVSESKTARVHFLHLFQKAGSTLSVTEWKKEINKETSLVDSSFFTLSKKDSMYYTNMFILVGMAILSAFIVLLFFIILIVMGHSVSTGIEMDYVNLGILKAQGFTKGKIRLVFILQYTLGMIAGALLGILAAIPLTKFLGGIFQPITGIHATADISVAKSLLVIAAILLIGAAFIHLKTAKIGKISPVNAISGGRNVIYFDSRIRMPISKKLFAPSLAFRQFTSDKKQYTGTIIIMSILVFFMMAMTILSNCMNGDAAAELMGAHIYDVDMNLKNSFSLNQKEEIRNEVEKITEVTMDLYFRNRYISLDGEDIFCSIYEDPTLYKSILKGRAPLYENEIIITEIMAAELNKAIGDTAKVKIGEKSGEYLITGYFQQTNDLGRVFGMNLEGAAQLDDIQMAWGEISLSDRSKANEVADMLNEKYADTLEATVSKESSGGLSKTIDAAFKSISVVIYVISVVFALVVIQMVCSRIFLKERRDNGIYKAIGFATARLRLQFALRFLIVAVIGALLGTGLCLLFGQKLLGMLLRTMGVTYFVPTYNIFVIGMPTLLVCICSFAFAYLSSRKIRQVSARELIVE